MQTIDASTWLSQAAVEKLGWVLVHSFWQLTAIALLAWLLDRALQRRSSSVRYWSLLLSLLVMMASSVVTWMMLPTSIDEDVAAVSDANPSLGLMMLETPLPATNMEPITPAKEIRTTAAEIQKSSAIRSASISLWMNQYAVLLKPWLGTIVSVWCFGACIPRRILNGRRRTSGLPWICIRMDRRNLPHQHKSDLSIGERQGVSPPSKRQVARELGGLTPNRSPKFPREKFDGNAAFVSR